MTSDIPSTETTIPVDIDRAPLVMDAASTEQPATPPTPVATVQPVVAIKATGITKAAPKPDPKPDPTIKPAPSPEVVATRRTPLHNFLLSAWQMLQTLIAKWYDDRILQQAAALSYFTIFSIAPLLIIVVAIAGLVLGHNAVQADVLTQVEALVGKDGAQLVTTMVNSLSQPAASIPAAILGFVALVLGAIGVFGQLKASLNQIWHAPIRQSAGPVKDLLDVARQVALLLLTVLVMGLLILMSLLIDAVLSSIGTFVNTHIGDPLLISAPLWSLVNLGISFTLTTLMFAAIYKILPDVAIAWKDVWFGSILTASLFTLGKFLIGLYLGRSSVTSAYGAAGSLVVILLWVNYSAQIFFIGAEFTHIYALRYGSAAWQQRHPNAYQTLMAAKQNPTAAEAIPATPGEVTQAG